MMPCPYCGEPLDMYERFWDEDDGEFLKGKEHYACYNCDRSFSLEVIYTLTYLGELEE